MFLVTRDIIAGLRDHMALHNTRDKIRTRKYVYDKCSERVTPLEKEKIYLGRSKRYEGGHPLFKRKFAFLD
jgi:hypothetical protein